LEATVRTLIGYLHFRPFSYELWLGTKWCMDIIFKQVRVIIMTLNSGSRDRVIHVGIYRNLRGKISTYNSQRATPGC